MTRLGKDFPDDLVPGYEDKKSNDNGGDIFELVKSQRKGPGFFVGKPDAHIYQKGGDRIGSGVNGPCRDGKTPGKDGKDGFHDGQGEIQKKGIGRDPMDLPGFVAFQG